MRLPLLSKDPDEDILSGSSVYCAEVDERAKTYGMYWLYQTLRNYSSSVVVSVIKISLRRTYNSGARNPNIEPSAHAEYYFARASAHNRRTGILQKHSLVPTLRDVMLLCHSEDEVKYGVHGVTSLYRIHPIRLSLPSTADKTQTHGLPIYAISFQSKDRTEYPIPLSYPNRRLTFYSHVVNLRCVSHGGRNVPRC